MTNVVTNDFLKKDYCSNISQGVVRVFTRITIYSYFNLHNLSEYKKEVLTF